MRRVREIELDELIRASERTTADSYVRLFHSAGLYATIEEDTENLGILLIWKLRDAVELLYQAEEKYRDSRLPSIFSISSIPTIVWIYLICIALVAFGVGGSVEGWLLFVNLVVGSTLVGLCFAILRWVQMRGYQKLSLMRCRTIQQKIKNYIQELSEINFCSAIGPQSIVLHHPQRKSIVAELREAQRIRNNDSISIVNIKLKNYDAKIGDLIKGHQQGYVSLDGLVQEIDDLNPDS
jgi:hypothetical protein